MEEVRVPLGDAWVTASVQGEGGSAVVLGHGAGGSRRTPFLLRTAAALASTGRRAVLYNFPYTDARRRFPDPPDRLEATTRGVGEYAASVLGAKRVVHGGKSMGGRIASQAVAKGAPAGGLVFFGYPLHAPGRTESLRDRHLLAVAVPMLFVQGTRDAFARWDLLTALLERLGKKATLHVVEDGDHSFVVPKRSGRSPADIEGEIVRAVVAWLQAHGL